VNRAAHAGTASEITLVRVKPVVVASAGFLALLVASAEVSAQTVRRRFDPEDLKLEEPGVVSVEMAYGVMRGEVAGRWLVPDFDINIGFAPNVELGIDGAWAIEGTPDRLFSLDHRAPDNVWLSSKLGLWATRDSAKQTAWAIGAQLGPRVPVAPSARGTGFQALWLAGRTIRRAHVVFNIGGLVDPGAEVSRGRPTAVLLGVDAQIDLDAKGTWSIAADVSGVFFVSPQKHQLATTAGPVWAATSWVDIGVNGLFGFLDGGDQYGVMVLVSPKAAIF
jgi:hypothetical protein